MSRLSEEGAEAVSEVAQFMVDDLPPVVAVGVLVTVHLFALSMADDAVLSEGDVALVSASFAAFLVDEPDLAIAVAGWAGGIGPR